jgi:hypothetical protein
VPPEVTAVYLAEDHLDEGRRQADEEAFAAFFGQPDSNAVTRGPV